MRSTQLTSLPALAALVSALVTPAFAQSPASDHDRAYQLLGTWSCKSDTGNNSKMTFTQNADGSISMKNAFSTPGGLAGQFDESYRFNAKSGLWQWTSSLLNSPQFQESGTAPPWNGDKWSFSGTVDGVAPSGRHAAQQAARTTQDIRMVYASLGHLTFSREFETSVGGSWHVTSTSTCKRSMPHA